MDRNSYETDQVSLFDVALRKESVDRNLESVGYYVEGDNVALRKESVDRNAK